MLMIPVCCCKREKSRENTLLKVPSFSCLGFSSTTIVLSFTKKKKVLLQCDILLEVIITSGRTRYTATEITVIVVIVIVVIVIVTDSQWQFGGTLNKHVKKQLTKTTDNEVRTYRRWHAGDVVIIWLDADVDVLVLVATTIVWRYDDVLVTMMFCVTSNNIHRFLQTPPPPCCCCNTSTPWLPPASLEKDRRVIA